MKRHRGICRIDTHRPLTTHKNTFHRQFAVLLHLFTFVVLTWKMKKNRLHTFTIILGSFVACAIIFSQFFTPEFGCSQAKANTEQTENKEDAGTESFVSMPAFSLPAPFHVQPDLQSYYLFEIFFDEGDESPKVEDDPIFTDRLLSTLFSVLISPNAP